MGLIPYGIISKSHGLKGAVRLITHSGDISSLDIIKSLHVKNREGEDFIKYNIEGHSISAGHAVLRLEGIDSIEKAEQLKGAEVYVDSDELPQAGEDEFYYHELEGMEVYDSQNRLIGNIIKLNDSGPQPFLEVEMEDGKEVLIPFVEPILVEVDIENNKIVVDPPPGLLDL